MIKTKILSYSLRWDIPFTANYFLYLTSPEVAYVFTEDASPMMSKVHKNITKFVMQPSAYVNKNYYKVKFISQNQDLSGMTLQNSVRNLKDSEVTGININPDELSVEFYKKSNDKLVSTGKSYYADDVTLVAAIYAENIGQYECNMQKALKRFKLVSDMLATRVQMIRPTVSQSCSQTNYYSQAESLLDELGSITEVNTVSQDKFSRISEVKETLSGINYDLNRQRCPTIY